jgi:glycoside/pentoside/hexuronide:cation symporter, GPH family
MKEQIERMPLWRIIMYALGQFGWSILTTMAGLVTYFYIPPETGQANFPVLITREAIFGMTVIGLSGFLAQIAGLFFDPMIGALSDRSKSRIGRRRFFMLISALPVSVICYFIFHPPTSGPSSLNAFWLIGAVVLFNLLMSVYRMPYGALIPEIGHTSKDRMFLCTITSVAWAFGFLLAGQLIYLFKDMLQSAGMSPVTAFRTLMAGFSILGFLLMILPVIFVDEKRYCFGEVSEEKPIESIIKAFQNKDWVIFTFSTTVYFMTDIFLQLGIVYYITVLMGLSESWVAIMGAAMFGMSFLWYPFVNIIADKISKKKMVIFSFILQAIAFAMIAVAGKVPGITTMAWAWIIIFLEGIIASIAGIVPGAIGADIIRADAIRTGIHKEGAYAGAGSFFMKIPMSLPPLVIPTLLLLGRSPDNDLGVRLMAVVALGLMIISLIILLFYNEKRTVETLAREKIEFKKA